MLMAVRLVSTAFAVATVDSTLAPYKNTVSVSGSIKSIGSDTMNNMMALWAEGFRGVHPGVKVEVEGKGSSTAPPALIAGTSNFGPMSRKMKAQEIEAFEKKFGYKPVQLRTSIDMLAVYVHKDNPIKGLTLQQIDAIFSKTRKGGYPDGHPHLGRPGPDRRVGRQAHPHVRPQLGLRHLRLLQEARPVQG